MEYFKIIQNIILQHKDRNYFVVNKLSKLPRDGKFFRLDYNQNFRKDRKWVRPPHSLNVPHGILTDKFDTFHEILKNLSSFDIHDFVKNPDQNRHKIYIHLPENDQHINHMLKLHNDSAYKFLNADFLSTKPMKGGYHARTSLVVDFATEERYVADLYYLIKMVKSAPTTKKVNELREICKKRIEIIEYILDYIGGYNSDAHKVKNKSAIIQCLNDFQKIIDTDAKDIGPYTTSLYRSSLSINLYYKDETDLLHLLFIKDNPIYKPSQTVIIRPLKVN
jgi:hypothetical protein